MQIFPNIFLVNGFPYGQHQNSYLVRLGEEIVMIDCGDLCTETFDLVRTNAAAWGIDLKQIRYLLITHAHFDHASHAAKLQSMGVKVVTNKDGADALSSGDDRCIGFAVHRQFALCKADRIIRDEEKLNVGGNVICCIEAPGHANSCVIYEMILNKRRLWFIGDVIQIGLECQSVELGWDGGPDYNRSTYLQTLEKLCHMECDCLFPGHGPPCLANGKRLLEMAYARAITEWR
jgi:glyoxylase-like metal-dependent hydrolase (beta-lactamase superfamily II)